MSPQFLSSTPLTASLLRGAIDLEHTDRGLVPHRLPAWARAQYADGQLAMAESQPSGVRLVFRTAATTIELDTIGTKVAYAGAPVRPDGLYDLVVDGQLTDQATVSGGDVLSFDLTSGSVEHRPGPGGTVAFTGLPAQAKDVEIWLPHNETTVLVELRTDAPVEAVTGDTRPVWLHHGSSISQGSNAASPSTTWPAIAASAAGVDLVNLGFGGSALLDPFTARTMRDQPADLISVAIGINLVNTDLMRLRALTPAVHGFLDTIRDGHPTTPLLVVSAIHCPMQEDTPGPITIDPATYGTAQVQFMATGNPAEVAAGKLTLRVIREELARIVASRAEADLNLHYLDGLELYGEADGGALPLPDKLHPDAATHRLIARRFAEHVFAPNGPFGG
ncbi:GDSL-type esterase/lipase family protein [Modestobacter sp. VKM Ac-2978]|nr:GDSL-type esterase/lipase family protein [Modestobacter sp. VKM Ac-2978]MCZ2850560.1 GDSL-type esterase/lipase family protein [Modestobacter sp. VKM Ac-2978]